MRKTILALLELDENGDVHNQIYLGSFELTKYPPAVKTLIAMLNNQVRCPDHPEEAVATGSCKRCVASDMLDR